MATTQDPADDTISNDYDLYRALSQGPNQPRNVTFESTLIIVSGKLKSLKFQESWYDGRQWLKYNLVRDEASCFYCRVPTLQASSERLIEYNCNWTE